LETIWVGKRGEQLQILIVNKVFDEFKIKWRRELGCSWRGKKSTKVMFSKTEASEAYFTVRGKST